MKSGEGRKEGERRERWVVTWEDVENVQLETMLAATPAERLAWLEEAMRLAHASGALAALRREREAKETPGDDQRAVPKAPADLHG